MEYIALDKSSDTLCINYPPNSRNNIARTIKVPDDVARLLDKYIYDNDIKEGPIFINRRKTRMKLRDFLKDSSKNTAKYVLKRKLSETNIRCNP